MLFSIILAFLVDIVPQCAVLNFERKALYLNSLLLILFGGSLISVRKVCCCPKMDHYVAFWIFSITQFKVIN